MNATKAVRPEVIEAMDRLREWYPKGSTVYTIVRKVARSGMSRVIGLLSIKNGPCDLHRGDGFEIRHPNHAASVVLGMRRSKDLDGIHVSGCGMDMGFHVAYELGRALYGDGYALRHEWL